ncbi:MAG: menaquinone reductase multiheme cytochrome c subunit QrcA [Bryobacteraceae bacterium]
MNFEEHRGKVVFAAGMLAALSLGWRGLPVALFEHRPQPVAFSHKVHADKAAMKCEDCHALREDGSFTGIPPLDKCSGCHTQPIGDTRAEKQMIERYVTPNREIPWQVYARQPEHVHFSHAGHLKLARLDCKQCHGKQGDIDQPPAATIDRISGYSQSSHWLNMDACSDCHSQRGADGSCLACHK